MDAQSPLSIPGASPKFQSPQPSSLNIRLWRPAAQGNLRTQWSKLASLWLKWLNSSSNACSSAASLVNSFLFQKYMDTMDLGVLSNMPDIRKKACLKLSNQQVFQHNELLTSYKEMVCIVNDMVSISRSMRCYRKGAMNSPIVKFSPFAESQNDAGDGGGIPVFTFWSISHFEKIAENFVQMFVSEINLKRLLVMEFLSLSSQNDSESNRLSWSDEFYPGEFEDLRMCNLCSSEACKPVLPSLHNKKAEASLVRPRHHQDGDVLKVLLTTWLAELNIDRRRVAEVFQEIETEIHYSLKILQR